MMVIHDQLDREKKVLWPHVIRIIEFHLQCNLVWWWHNKPSLLCFGPAMKHPTMIRSTSRSVEGMELDPSHHDHEPSPWEAKLCSAEILIHTSLWAHRPLASCLWACIGLPGSFMSPVGHEIYPLEISLKTWKQYYRQTMFWRVLEVSSVIHLNKKT